MRAVSIQPSDPYASYRRVFRQQSTDRRGFSQTPQQNYGRTGRMQLIALTIAAFSVNELRVTSLFGRLIEAPSLESAVNAHVVLGCSAMSTELGGAGTSVQSPTIM